jgi:hypothetical protein
MNPICLEKALKLISSANKSVLALQFTTGLSTGCSSDLVMALHTDSMAEVI